MADDASREALRQKGAAYLDAVLSAGDAGVVAAVQPLSTTATSLRAARRSAADPDILAVGSFLEHARLGALLLLFGVCTSAQSVLLSKALFYAPRAFATLATLQLLAAGLVHAAAVNGALVAADATLSLARARAAAPDALFHVLLTVATLLVIDTGGVPVFVAVTAACVPPLCAWVEAVAGGGSKAAESSRKGRAAVYGAALASCVVLMRLSMSLLLSLALFLGLLVTDRVFDSLRRLPRSFMGDVEGGSHGAAADGMSMLTLRVQQLSDAVAGRGNGTPTAYERCLYGNALPLPLIAFAALLRGEIIGAAAIEWSLASLGALVVGAVATAGVSLAALLLAETQLLPGPVQARATAACNAAALLLNVAVGVPPVGVMSSMAALGAVAAGAAFRLAT